MEVILTLVFAAAAAHGFVTDRRRMRNAIYVGFAITFLVLSITAQGGNNTIVGVGIALVGVAFLLSIPALAVVLIANGVTMIRREGRSLANLLTVPLGLLILVAPILPFYILSQHNTWLIWGSLWIIMLLGYLGFVFASYLAYSFLYTAVPERFVAKYVVVLGSGLINGKVTPLLASRLTVGIEKYADFRALTGEAVIIPSGGQGPDEPMPEGVAMREYLTEHGVPSGDIIVEDQARNTEENLIKSRLLIPEPDEPMAVVTNNYHVFRTALLTRKLGITAHVYGAPTATYFLPSALIREFVAILVENKWVNLLIIGGLTGLCVVGLRATL